METGSIADWFAGTMSLAAVMVALGGYWLVERAARKNRVATQREAGHRILVKLINVTNTIYTLHSLIEEDAAREPMVGPDGPELWRIVQPRVGFSDSDEVQFDAAEVTVLLEAKAMNFSLDLLLLGKRHNALVRGMREYSLRRDAIQQLQPTPIEFSGPVGTIEFSREEYLKVRPYTIALESIIINLRESCAKDLKFAVRMGEEFGPIMRKYLRDPDFPLLAAPKVKVGS